MTLVFCFYTPTADAGVRIKDITRIHDKNELDLFGYGLVIGLDGSGDSKSTQFTMQSLANMMQRIGVTVDANQREVFVAGQAAQLSTFEFQLIWYLAQHSGCVVARDEIYRELRNSTYNGYDRSIDVYVSRIRQKIGDDSTSPKFLKTVRGVGYQFVCVEN